MRIFKFWTTFRHELSKFNAKLSFLINCRREEFPEEADNKVQRNVGRKNVMWFLFQGLTLPIVPFSI